MIRYLDLLAGRVASAGGFPDRTTPRESLNGPLRHDSQPRPAVARPDRPGQLRDLGPPGLGAVAGLILIAPRMGARFPSTSR